MRRWPYLLLLAGLLAGCDRGTEPALVGKAAPDFTVQDSDRKLTLRDHRGKVVVLNFWATWCPPCVEETPSLVALQQRTRPKVEVIAVSVDVDEKAYRDFVRDYKMDGLTNVRDPEGKKSSGLYGTWKYPETYIIDENGVLRRKFIGPVDWTDPNIVDYLNKL
ncbi:MAG TPA: TlpA disulfide reductase family protein [Terriglobales bacterium]|nr:TlpA disulfide reductase family protein [Terriglobales bacterium]